MRRRGRIQAVRRVGVITDGGPLGPDVASASSWMVESFTSSNWRLPLGVVDCDLVAFFLVQQRAADRRRGRDQPLLRVRVFRHDELIDGDRPVARPSDEPSIRTRPCRAESGRRSSVDLADALLQQADRDSTRRCRSFAAWYSAFSRRSPSSRARLISFGSSVFSSWSSAWISSSNFLISRSFIVGMVALASRREFAIRGSRIASLNPAVSMQPAAGSRSLTLRCRCEPRPASRDPRTAVPTKYDRDRDVITSGRIRSSRASARPPTRRTTRCCSTASHLVAEALARRCRSRRSRSTRAHATMATLARAPAAQARASSR